jgi:hypothetical protein
MVPTKVISIGGLCSLILCGELYRVGDWRFVAIVVALWCKFDS